MTLIDDELIDVGSMDPRPGVAGPPPGRGSNVPFMPPIGGVFAAFGSGGGRALVLQDSLEC